MSKDDLLDWYAGYYAATKPSDSDMFAEWRRRTDPVIAALLNLSEEDAGALESWLYLQHRGHPYSKHLVELVMPILERICEP